MKTISTTGGGGTPYNNLYGGGRLRPRGVRTFSAALVGKYMKGQGFYLFKCMKNYGNLSFWSVIEPKKRQADITCGCERDKKTSWVPWLIYIQKKVQIQQLTSKLSMWEEYYLSVEGIQKG